MVAAVGGNGGYGSGKGFVLADDLRRQLAHLRLQKALIVKLVRWHLWFPEPPPLWKGAPFPVPELDMISTIVEGIL